MRIWTAWTAAVLGSFAALEASAYLGGRFPTYSRVLARWFGYLPTARRRHVMAGTFLLCWGALTAHVMQYGRESITSAGLVCPPPLDTQETTWRRKTRRESA